MDRLTNEELDAFLVRKLPGYQSVFAAGPEQLIASPFFSWRQQGTFTGWPRLEWRGPLDYIFSQYADDDFGFVRHSGEKIRPDYLKTDGGSIPRPAWIIPGLSPWDYLPAYVIHDWDFHAHHTGASQRTFEEVNLTLAEGIYTLMKTGVAGSDWVRIEIIYRAVSSPIGKRIWDHAG